MNHSLQSQCLGKFKYPTFDLAQMVAGRKRDAKMTPYSFVIDWFVPIGTYLENLNTIPSLRGRFMTTTLRRFSGSAVSISPSYKWAVVPTTHTSQVFLDRKISTSLSVPKPSFNSFEDAMSPKRIWNAIALAVQRF